MISEGRNRYNLSGDQALSRGATTRRSPSRPHAPIAVGQRGWIYVCGPARGFPTFGGTHFGRPSPSRRDNSQRKQTASELTRSLRAPRLVRRSNPQVWKTLHTCRYLRGPDHPHFKEQNVRDIAEQRAATAPPALAAGKMLPPPKAVAPSASSPSASRRHSLDWSHVGLPEREVLLRKGFA